MSTVSKSKMDFNKNDLSIASGRAEAPKLTQNANSVSVGRIDTIVISLR